jgi:ribonuclease HI
MVTKYYAVVSGVIPGIYTDWNTTEKMVKGYPGALFKCFTCKHDAEIFMERSTFSKQKNIPQPNVLPLANKTIVYTHGSCSNKTRGGTNNTVDSGYGCGFGIVIITNMGDRLTAYGKVPSTVMTNGPTNNSADLYAIYVGLSLVKGDIILYSDSEYAIGCLTTYIHDWARNGWKGVSNRSLIEGSYNLMTERSVVLHHVDGYSNIALNEEADMLANLGKTQNDHLIVFKNGQRIM